MERVSIDRLIEGLKAIPDESFVCENVYDYLSRNPVSVDSIERYFFWNPDNYTRNLVYKDERFELMVVCWDRGVSSRVHNHWDQRCWMTVPIGRLKGQNFAVESIDEDSGHCRLRETDSFELSECLAAKVELEEPIHQILNLAEFDERAVSIHIYSKPYDRCLSYCRDTDTFKEVQLFYHSVGGRLAQGVAAGSISNC